MKPLQRQGEGCTTDADLGRALLDTAMLTWLRRQGLHNSRRHTHELVSREEDQFMIFPVFTPWCPDFDVILISRHVHVQLLEQQQNPSVLFYACDTTSTPVLFTTAE